MDSRKIVNFFFKTFFIGGIVGFIASFFINSAEYAAVLNPFNAKELLGVSLFYLGYALVFTVIAQTGFFAYLFVHRYGEGFFRSFWPTVQVLVILFALFDLIYFTSKLQNQVQQLFYESLGHNGFLCLGNKETLRFSDIMPHYIQFNPNEQIYQKIQ